MSSALRSLKGQLTKLGRAMLIPVVAMPVAGLLARFGQPDMLNMDILKMAADVVFGNLDMLFAVGCVLAFTYTKDKSIVVLGAVLSLLVFRQTFNFLDAESSMGIFAGIVSGICTAYLYNVSKDWEVPSMFQFFAGEKFILTLGPLASIPLAYAFSFIWPPLEYGLDAFSIWLGGLGLLGVFLFGFLNRLLIPTGIHHILNAYIFFEIGSFVTSSGTVVTGEMSRFLAGDPTAGSFLSMFFVIMIFGIPGAGMAMVDTAYPESKKEVKGLVDGGILTSVFAGITEPIEFSFMFVGPVLYLLHAIYTGLAGAILYLLQTRIGFAFGFNIIDLVLNWKLGHNVFYIIPVGVGFYFLYYYTFKAIILKKDIKTPGRVRDDGFDEQDEMSYKLAHSNYGYMAKKILQFVGGAQNVISAENCVTRMRLELVDISLINKEKIMQTGAKGVVIIDDHNIQIIIGTDVGKVMDEFKELI